MFNFFKGKKSQPPQTAAAPATGADQMPDRPGMVGVTPRIDAELRSLLGPLETRNYKPLDYRYFMRPRDLPLFTFNAIEAMNYDPTVRLGLAARAAPLCNPEFAYKQGEKWVPGIQAESEVIAAFVERQLLRIWNQIGCLLDAQKWGWAAAEVTYELSHFGLVEVNELHARHARDVRVIKDDGRAVGCRFLNIKNEANGFVDLFYPSCIFHNHQPEAGEDYGTSINFGAFSPWCDKWLDGGALDVRRLFMHKDAYGGADIAYPEGKTLIGDQQVPNRDIAREIVEQLQAGGVTTRPSKVDANGNKAWELTRASVPSNPTHILDYPKDLDTEILRGMEVPDDVLSAENSGAWAGKQVPMAAFYTSLDRWLQALVRDIVRQILKRLVRMNFGPGHWFEVSTKPLAVQAMEQQSKGSGAPPQPGQAGKPGQGDALGDDSMADDDGDGDGVANEDTDFERAVGMGLMRAAKTVKRAVKVVRMGEVWRTLGGSAKDGKQHSGGFPALIDEETGNIKASRVGGLEGKHVSEVGDHFKQAKGQKNFLGDPAEHQERFKTEPNNDAKRGKERARSNEPPEQEGNNAPAVPKHGKTYNVATDQLHVDPTRFQYKVKGINKSGVTDELKGVKFNPDFAGVLAVWQDPADGKTYVVNGHHRHDLAKSTNHPELSVRYLDSPSAEHARAQGALINIAEGRGAALDAAKFMRDTGRGLDDMQNEGISVKGRVAADAGHLSKLSDKAFNNVAQGMLDEDTGVAVAKHLTAHEDQDELFKFLERRADEGKEYAPKVIEEMARERAAAPRVSETVQSLFGEETYERNLIGERAELKAHIRGEMAKEMHDFAAVASQRRAERVSSAGNVLDVAENKARAELAENDKWLYDKWANAAGPISDAINAGAVEYANAKSKRDRERIKRETFERVRAAVRDKEQEVFGRGMGKDLQGGESARGSDGDGTPNANESGPGGPNSSGNGLEPPRERAA